MRSEVSRPDPSAGAATGGYGDLPGNLATGGYGLVGFSYHEGTYPKGKKKPKILDEQIIQEDEELLELIAMVMATGILEE